MVVGDIGKVLQLNTGSDRTGYNVFIVYCKPDGTTGEWEASINADDPTIIEYTLKDGDIDQYNHGLVYWTARAKIETTGKEIYGDWVKLNVEAVCQKG